MNPAYFNYGELAPEIAPGAYHQPPRRYALGYEVVNPPALLEFGGVACDYAPAMYEPLPAGHVLGMHQYHAFETMVSGTRYLPYEPQFISVLPTVFQRGLTLVESMPTAYHLQAPAGIAHQPGYFEYPIAANQSGINNCVCRVNTHSHHLPPPPANMEFVAVGPNMQTLSDDYSMSGTALSGFEQEIAPGMYPMAFSNGFDVSSMPDGQLQQNSSRISDTAPSSSSQQQTKPGQAKRSKRTRSANKLKPSVKSGIQKPSSRRVPKASAPNQSCLEKKKKKIQPPTRRTEPRGKFTEPVYHITWTRIAEEDKLLDHQCPICDKGLSYSPSEEDGEDGGSVHYVDSEPSKVPEVAILPCGHAFHSECLKLYTPEDQSSNPPCFLCFSSI